jgi:type I restriction enzyme S subunit
MAIEINWTNCTLGDAVNLKRGYDLPERDRVDGEYPIVSSSGVTGSHNAAMVRGPGVVTGRYGTLGQVFYVPSDFWPLNTSLYVQDFKGNHPLFISYLLQTLNFGQRSGAAAVPGVNRNALHMLRIRKPDLSTQRKIVATLSVYDDLIENNARRIKILEEMAQNLYREWFVKFRFPGHQHARFTDSPLGQIPEGWEVVTVDGLCDYISRGVTPQYEAGSARFIINQKANAGGEITHSNLKELTSDFCVPAGKFARTGDLLVNCLGEGTIGRVHLFLFPDNEWAVDQHMSICRSSKLANTLYLYYVMHSPEGQAKIQSLKSGGTNMTTFNMSALKAYDVILPTEQLLDRFYEIGWGVFQLKGSLQRKNTTLRRTRDLLLPRLISGEVDVSALDIAVPEEAQA